MIRISSKSASLLLLVSVVANGVAQTPIGQVGPSARSLDSQPNDVAYVLRRAGDGGGGDGLPVEVAAIYTPYLVSALRERWAPPWPLLAEPNLLHVAFRGFEGFRDHDPLAHAISYIVAIPRGPLQLRDAVRPLDAWPGAEFQKRMGFPPPWDDIAVVAAFPMTQWNVETDFVLVREANHEGKLLRQHKHARIPRDAFASWK